MAHLSSKLLSLIKKVGITVAIFACLYTGFRYFVMEKAIHKISSELESKYAIQLTYNGIAAGINSVSFQSISCRSLSHSLTMEMKNSTLYFSPIQLLSGNLFPYKIEIENGVWIKTRFGEFDIQQIELKINREGNEVESTFKGTFKSENILIKSPILSKDDIYIRESDLNFVLNVQKDAFQLISPTQIEINGIPADLFLDLRFVHPKHLNFTLKMPAIKAQSLLDGLPFGLFESLNGMEMDGYLSYYFKVFLQLEKPFEDSIDAQVENHDLKITRMGKEDLNKIKNGFLYPIYQNDQLIRTIDVSASNPNFTPLKQISPLLIKSVLASEDLTFMSHEGIFVSSLENALQIDLNEKSLKLGGSTITMQLVKNVFLHQEKTLGRKLEEIVLAWLIENLHLATKQDILESYLNIAEWGPGVFGIREASEFYFAKSPYELNLNESLFLSYLLSRPSHYKEAFENDGTLKPTVKAYQKRIVSILEKNRMITQEEVNSFVPGVKLKYKDAYGLKRQF